MTTREELRDRPQSIELKVCLLPVCPMQASMLEVSRTRLEPALAQ